MDFTFDRARGNLLTRKRKDDRKYFFDYDLLDRLTTVRRDLSVPGLHPNLPHDKLSIGVIGMSTDTVMVMGYSADGNIHGGGAWAGAKAGGFICGWIGSWFGGAGAVPGGIIGCAAGGILGAFCGPELFENIREKIEL